ncbi:hypothetical protein [Pannonibacter phragmitetus]|uniref:hypothetical protein n=1 Tax=Pannonibacter phragmitetus TaxID=121719 RepID=UPI003D2F21AB
MRSFQSPGARLRHLLAVTLFQAALPLSLATGAILPTVMTAPAMAEKAYEPERGSDERTAILDSARPIMEVRVGAPVEFSVRHMRVADVWAFAILDPQRPGGKEIDLSKTLIAEEMEYRDGPGLFVLLREVDGYWYVVDFAIGPTDVYWLGQPLYDQLPKGLLPVIN